MGDPSATLAGVARLDALLDRPAWAPDWVPTVDDVGAMRILRWMLYAVFFAGLTACVVEGADSPADPELVGDPTVTTTTHNEAPDPTSGSLAARFGTVLVDLVSRTGEAIELCLLHADVPEERSRGLMEVTDLDGHDGMLFSWDEPSQSSFVMIDTVMPLSISWWDGAGDFVSGLDMDPCTEPVDADCARYRADGLYRYAIEVPQGSLPEAGPGARIEVRGATCQPG